MKRNILFLAGHRKGGTTLLLNLLDGHPELTVYPQDVQILYGYYPEFIKNKYSDEERVARLDRVIFGQIFKQRSKLGWLEHIDLGSMRSFFNERVGDIDLTDIGSILELQLEAFAFVSEQGGNERTWSVVKETSIEIYAGELLERFSASRMIHLIRDPRDNYAAIKSGLRTYYSNYNDDANTLLASLIQRLCLGWQLAENNVKRFGKDRYLVLRHEDVTTDNEKMMRELTEFLSIEFNPSLLIPTVLNASTRGNNFEKMDMSRVRSVNVNRWKERINEDEAKILEFHFGNLMDTYGYQREFNVDECADAAAGFYKWCNNKYFYFDHFAEPVDGFHEVLACSS